MKEIKGYKEKEKEEIGEGEEKEKVIEKGKQEIEKQCCMHIGYAKKTIPLYHHSNNSARKKKKMNKVKNEEKDEKEDNHNHTMKEGIFSLNQNKNAIFPTAPLENVDLEHVIEKMAMYVVVKGKGFETKMREEKKQFPLFSFLREGGEGNEYYKWRVFCALNGISEEESDKRVIRYAQGKRWDVPECFLGARHPIISKIVRPDEEEEKCADGKEEAEKGIRTQNDGDCNRKQSNLKIGDSSSLSKSSSSSSLSSSLSSSSAATPSAHSSHLTTFSPLSQSQSSHTSQLLQSPSNSTPTAPNISSSSSSSSTAPPLPPSPLQTPLLHLHLVPVSLLVFP
ncbi:putative Surp module [Monocercomonoides exilis]|uniref:putative Surp module n=1 Tax=Monocercomonoides exilis TaxID=2049356 RepID=UPI003559E340|nr:putative Surp module [Monocercomonoides exilis]|eukprot:MONOS_15176.1-p1 / transcript=MONOS_15176.1 / gene=MONOS_15176 / organism=Monocercomonoides_exilis_PA203 / gene_product=unspecified product / transcript_product=unspecified product / location=Mono_scaffold01162:8355-9368(+) / protein_length=337 / sequence_SO=supercontig / SO=protein_coding / is_pseudo=false